VKKTAETLNLFNQASPIIISAVELSKPVSGGKFIKNKVVPLYKDEGEASILAQGFSQNP
jgi:hypothetical protein